VPDLGMVSPPVLLDDGIGTGYVTWHDGDGCRDRPRAAKAITGRQGCD
jgi:hypothetical protein